MKSHVMATNLVKPNSQSVDSQQTLKHNRLASLWVALAISVLVLLLLMIFILQNSLSVRIHFLALHATLSFGVAILLAAIAGSILTLLVGTARIIQLKHFDKTKTGI